MGIYHIDQALKIPVEYPENVMDDSFKEAVAMVQKMKGTRGEVLQRITQIMKSPAYEKEKSASPELVKLQIDLHILKYFISRNSIFFLICICLPINTFIIL